VPPTQLLAVPNVSEGQDGGTLSAVAQAIGDGLLDVHSDPDHNRSVFTLTAPPGELRRRVLAAAAAAVERIDLRGHAGAHPRVGALDVAPIVYLDDASRGAACAEALALAHDIGEQLGVPVFLYGILTEGHRTRAELRRGGPAAIQRRIELRELRPDFGPARLHPTAGATLVAARPPLVAFNVELAPPATVQDARRIAALIREAGPEGLPGVRAIGVDLAHRGRAQVSTNVEDHEATPLRALIEAITRHAQPERAELIGLAPRAAFEGFPEALPVANRRYIEDALTD
jgi:glutamate formiminotransferase